MKKHKKLIIEKFIKKDKICNICQQEKDLSVDHVPPKACPPAKNVVISKLLYEMTGNRSFIPRLSQSGVTYKTICCDCNNKLGDKYDWALGEFSRKVESFVESSLVLPDSFEIECYPNAIMRSVLGHILAAKTQTDEVVVDTLIRPSIFDGSLPIHNDIHIFYWVYPYERISILRDLGNTDGCWRNITGAMLVKLAVQTSADSTCCAVIMRVLRYALGANCINQLLYKSTDWAISCFHKWGLSALTGT